MRAWKSLYIYDTPLFVQEVLGATPEPWQIKVLGDYDGPRREAWLTGVDRYAIRISIASGHGVGKTTVLSWIAIHHALTLYPQKAAVTAPSSPQLFDALWPEIRSWINKMPPLMRDLLDVKSERIEHKEDPSGSFITAKTSRADQPEALQGVHQEHVLLMADEASGIPDAVIEAAGGSMSGRRVVMILAGNPLRGQGFFYDTHHKLKGTWKTHTVSVFDSSWASPEYATEMESRYGKESNMYRTKVLGLFPLSDDDVVIPFELVIAAVGRDVTSPENCSTIWGLDVAFMGSNRTVLAKRRCNELLEPPLAWGGLDDAQVAGRVKLEWDLTPADRRPSDINIDSIGYGSAVATRLEALGLPARRINVSETPALKDSQCRNLRCELMFKEREWFAKRDVRLPAFDKDHRIEDLIEEATTQTFKPQPVSGKILIAPKTGRTSPDLNDALMLTFASESIILTGENRGGWTKRPALDNPVPGIV